MSKAVLALVAACVCAGACANPEKERLKATTKPTYDPKTGKLTELTFDYNKNGRIDTWLQMDGARPVLGRADLNEDGTLDRWEYYDDQGKLVKVGFSRKGDGQPDAWAFNGGDGKVERIDISSTSDDKKIDRWEYYAADVLARSEDDANKDGVVDQWSTYEKGLLKTTSFDDDRDGRPDRRWTYQGPNPVLVETEPDSEGRFTKRKAVAQ